MRTGPVPRFLCDHMLIRLGRWLRAAGYDTEMAGGAIADRNLLARAVREDRLLLTRDRKLREFRDAPGRVVLLRGNGVEACAAELTERQPVDWLYRPFTRCLDCNTPLGPAGPQRQAPMPDVARAAAAADDLRWCRHCRKFYWPGGHVRRMRRRLEQWRSGAFGPPEKSPD